MSSDGPVSGPARGRSTLNEQDSEDFSQRYPDAATDSDVGERSAAGPAGLVLTVLYHSEPARIGEQHLAPWQVGTPLVLNRFHPAFLRGDGTAGGPLAEPGVSRRGLSLRPEHDGLAVTCDGELPYRLAGRPLARASHLPMRLLAEGVLLQCGRGVLLWLEARDRLPTRHGRLGIEGVSQQADRVRTRVRQLSGHRVPVMITGESDTGRRRVAEALHQSGPTPGGPLIVASAARWDAHAVRRDFQRARGGTLLLEGVERLREAAQIAISQALTEQAEDADDAMTRLVSTCAVDPGALVDDGRLLKALAYRLYAVRIAVAPLRERPIDVPLLFVGALSRRLAELGSAELLTSGRDAPWLRRALVESLLRHGWPGNHRELDNLALEVALGSRESHRAILPAYWQPRPVPGGLFGDPVAAVRSPVTPLPPDDDRPWPVPPERLREALRAREWRVRAVAADLGVARNTIYSMMARLGIRRPSDLTAADIVAAARAEGSTDPARVARRLEISERGLKLRLHALDLALE